MKNWLFISFIISIALLAYACDPLEEEITRDSNIQLTFSTDTVLFDTVLSTVGSITRRLKIYNRDERAIELSQLRLGTGDESSYTITVNGEVGSSFENTVILGEDSLLVLVEVLIDPQNEETPFLVKDSLVVESNGNMADVKLVAYGQDAIFIDGGVFNCDVTLTAGRPYVIRNFALVDTLCSLTMEPGTRVLMDNDAFLAVRGRLLIQGDTASPVVINSTRIDGRFANGPGQWRGIFFLDGSTGNMIDHAVIRNSEIGLSAGSPDNTMMIDLDVNSTVIENMSFAGIFAFNAQIRAVNNVINNCGTYMIFNAAGGDYVYHHNTFSNLPNSFIRDDASVQFSDRLEDLQTGEVFVNDLRLEMINNIIWGGQSEELVIFLTGERDIDVRNNIIRSEDLWIASDNFASLERNFPGFENINFTDFRIDSLGFARDKGLPLGVEFDILDLARDEMPDIGAYERVDPE